MHVKALGSSRKHPRSGPLLGPQANPRENAFLPPYKFAKKSTVPLRVNLSRENFNARDPSILDLTLAPIRSREFARVHPSDRKSTRLNSSHSQISYAVFCLKKKKNTILVDL